MTYPAPVTLPTRFFDAELINPYRVLLDLHDHALRRSSMPSREDALAELALAAAAVSWWTRWQPISIHTALRTGASLADIAAATGLDEDDVVRRWTRWVDVQSGLVISGRPGVDPGEVRTIRDRLHCEADR